MRILVVDSAPPGDLQQGLSLIAWHVFRRLRHHHLTLLAPAPPAQLERSRDAIRGVFHEVHLVAREDPVPAFMGMLEPTLARVNLPRGKRGAYVAVRAMQRQLQHLVSSGNYDVIHARQLHAAVLVRSVEHPRKLLELVDSASLQTARRRSLLSPKALVRAIVARPLERYAVRHFDACTTVAAADAAVVRSLVPGVPVHVVPNGVDAEYFRPLMVPEQPRTLVFVGAMSYPPNVTAVLHFYREVLPLIRRELPDVRLHVVGRDPASEIVGLRADPLVTVTGSVDDVRPWIAAASISVCPMVMGSGIKNKVLEALAMARPVVTTSLGAEALEVTDGRELRIADAPADFARAVLDLLADRERALELGEAGREVVRERYTWDACASRYDALYAQLAASSSTPGRIAARAVAGIA